MQNKVAAASSLVFSIQLSLVTAALALLVVAAAQPRWGVREEVVAGSSRNVLIVLDVSRSMLATDVHPNRLERAKADVVDLLDQLQGDRAGIMAFRSGAALLCPFTSDMSFLLQALAGTTVDSAPRGETNIGGAIDAALETFAKLGTDHNAIILISDGEDLSGKAAASAAVAGERGIPIFCVGIGGASGSTIPTDTAGKSMEYKGESVITKLDNKTLMDIAKASKGSYIPLQTSATGRNTLGDLYDRHVRAITAQEMQERRESSLVERYQIFLLPALVLLMAAGALSHGRPGKRRKAKASIAAAALLAAAMPVSLATNETASAPVQATAEVAQRDANTVVATPRKLARAAQKAWQSGDPATAAELYAQALESGAQGNGKPAPELMQTIRFNAALSYLKAGNSGKAADMFREIASDAAYGPRAAEGLGVALFRAAEAMDAMPDDSAGAENTTQQAQGNAEARLKLVEEAAAAFQKALRELPEDGVRTDNLNAAVALMPGLRDKAYEAAVAAKYGDKKAEDLLPELIKLQRDVFSTSAKAFSNSTPERIAMLEGAATAQQEAADIWGPLYTKMMEIAQNSETNQQVLADFKHSLDVARDRADGAIGALENLDESAMDAMRESEGTAMRLLSVTAPPPVVLAEAINSQSNTLATTSNANSMRTPVAEHIMASGLFEAFSNTYGPWLDRANMAAPQEDDGAGAPQEAAQAQPTNMVLTAEIRKEIDNLVSKTLGTHALMRMDIGPHDQVLNGKARVNAEQALANMIRIMELLPKPPERQKQQQQQQDQDKNDQKEDQQQNQEQNQQNEEQQNGEKQDQQQPEEQQQQDDEAQKKDIEEQKTAEEKEAEQIMAQILEQEKRREDERRERMRTMPPRVGERDW